MNKKIISILKVNKKGGFTLLELMITVSIYIIISSIVITNYRDYGKDAVASNAHEDVFLALREAQVYGAGGRGCGNANPFDCRFGVSFSTNAGIEDGFTVFSDENDNKVYDAELGNEDIIIETIKWKTSKIIKVECLRYTGLDTICSDSVLNITFKRPNPDALINDTADMSGLLSGGYEQARIIISNGIIGEGQKTSTTTINNAGQMSLQ